MNREKKIEKNKQETPQIISNGSTYQKKRERIVQKKKLK